MNPNQNENAYRQALQINRDLKRENDKLKDVIKQVDNFLRSCDVQTAEEDREIGRLQELISSLDLFVEVSECSSNRRWGFSRHVTAF